MLKGNVDKCHLLVSSNDAVNLRVSEFDMKNSEREKLLDVKFENKLTFEKHITDICGEASRKFAVQLLSDLEVSQSHDK